MILRLSRAFLIAAAALACASKLHTQNRLTPVIASQELTRCLSVVRAAARKGAATGQPSRRVTPGYLFRPYQ